MAQQFYSPLQLNSTLTVGVDDTGYDVKFFGATSGAYMLWDESANQLRVSGASVRFDGTGDNFILKTDTGNLKIQVNEADHDLLLQSDDGSGSIATYIKLDGTNVRTAFSKNARFSDSVELELGSGGDGHLKHDGSDMEIYNTTGNLTIKQDQNDGDIILLCDDGSGGTTAYLTLDGSQEAVVFGKAPHIPEYILHVGDGNTYFGFATDDTFRVGVGGTQRLNIATGIELTGNTTLTGNLTVGVDDTGHDVKFFGATSGRYMQWDESADSLILVDNVQLQLGSSSDIRMLHDGTDSKIRSTTSDLYITQEANDKDIIFQSDDGSGGVATYFTIDGSAATNNFNKSTFLPDDNVHFIGNSYDLRIYHSSSSASYIHNDTGHLYIENDATDGDIVFRSDDGSGGLSTYFRVDGGLEKTIFPDNQTLGIGSGGDFNLKHDGSNTLIENTTGHVYFYQKADDSDIIFLCDDGSGGNTTYFQLDGSHTETVFSEDIRFADDKSAKFGDSSDLTIHHNGSNSYITQGGTGDLYIMNTTDNEDIIFVCDDGAGGNGEYFRLDGSQATHDGSATTALYTVFPDLSFLTLGSGSDLQLYHNGTTSRIVNETGNLEIINNTNDGDVILKSDDGSGGNTAYITLDGSATQTLVHKTMTFSDNVEARFGSGGDLHLYHNGTNSFIKNYTGDLYILNDLNDKDIIFQSDDGSGGVTEYLSLDGSIALVKFTKDALFKDSVKAKFGDGVDLEIYSDGDNGVITHDGGTLTIKNTTDDSDIIFQSDDGSGGTTEYFRVDGSSVQTIVTKNFRYLDDAQAMFGTSEDLAIYHDATNSYVNNATGDLYIKNTADDKDIIFQTDDNSGGVTTYMNINGEHQVITLSKNLQANDNVVIKCGTGGDLQLKHDGTDNFMFSHTASDFYIQQKGDDKDIIFQCDDGSGGLQTYLWMDGSAANGTNTYTRMDDNSMMGWGTGFDMYMYHNGTNSYLTNATGDLYIGNGADDKDIIFQCDDGSGGLETYFKLDGSASSGNPYTVFPDNSLLAFGSSNDFILNHNGTNTNLGNYTGDLEIVNYANDKDVIFKSDDGSGGTETYFFLDGSGHNGTYARTIFPDNSLLGFGTGFDSYIYHDGSHFRLQNNTGDLKITCATDDGDIIFSSDNGSGGTTEYFRLDGGIKRTIFTENIGLEDNTQILIGAGNDLQLYHNGSHSLISNQGGNLYIRQQTDDGDILIQADDGSGGDATYMTFNGGDTTIDVAKNMEFADDVKAFFGTDNDGSVYVNGGNLYIDQDTADKDIIFRSDNGSGGTTTYLTLDGSATSIIASKNVELLDDVELKIGTGNDLNIRHNGSNSFIQNQTGDLTIQNATDDGDILFKCDDGSGGVTAYLTLDGSSGYSKAHKHILYEDDVKAMFGTGGDMQILHDGSNSYISHNVTGHLYIQNNTTDADIVLQSDDGSGGTTAYITLDGSATTVEVAKDTNFAGNVTITGGNSGQFTITSGNVAHDASIDLDTGDSNGQWRIKAEGSDETFQISNVDQGGTSPLSIHPTTKTTTLGGNIVLPDDGNIGSASDTDAISIDDSGVVTFSSRIKANVREFEVASGTDGDAKGDVVYFGSTTSMTAGAIYHYKSDGTWELVDADSAATCDGLLAVALGAASNTNGMLLRGMVTIANDPGAVGDVLYASTTAGQATATAPSGSGDIVRVIGYCVHATNGNIWFNPDGTFVEVA